MVSCLDFRVLGPLETRIDGTAAQLGTPKRRKLLALLVLHANRVVSSLWAAEELWGDRPPESAASNLRSYASSLRAMLPQRERSRLVARPTGYLLRVDASEVDLGRFAALVDEGNTALEDNDPYAAVQVLGQALALWRGEPVEDLAAGPVLAPMLAALSERRLTAIEGHAAARLRIGQIGQVIPDLRDLLARHPCREYGWALLMSARYWSGDIAGALEGFAAARSALSAQLGIEPGDELQRLHQAILNRSLEGPRACPAASLGPARPAHDGQTGTRLSPVPRQLPAPPALVTQGGGQLADQLVTVTRALCGGSRGSSPWADNCGGSRGSSPWADNCGGSIAHSRACVVIVHGVPGSGKSALAITAAHQIAGHFPDGQLYLDLQNTLGGEVAAARLRSALVGRRMLLFLDNVIDPAAARTLIPAEAGCAVLITACQSLGTVDAATRVTVQEPPAAAATELLLSLTGSSRVAGPSEVADTLRAAGQVIQHCGRLPLALRIVAGRLASRPDLSLKILARRLRDERTRLDELCFEGLSVRRSLTRCHRQLTGPQAAPGDQVATRLFELLGQRGARRVHPRLAAALLGQPADAANRAADRLAEVGLLTAEGQPGRYRVPELTRLFAAEVAGQPAGRRPGRTT